MQPLVVSKKVLQQLEFPKIIELLQQYCKGDLARAHIEEQEFVIQIDQLRRQLLEVYEATQMSTEEEVSWTLDEYVDISQSLEYLSKEGYVLSLDRIIELRHVLLNYEHILPLFTQHIRTTYPHISAVIDCDSYTDEALQAIDKVVDESGEMRDDASPELLRLSRRKLSINKELDSVFNKILGSLQKQNLLSENPESWRNGRRVLVLPVENKRKIDGIIHDQSTTGKTVFLEPAEVTRLNNELLSLDNERRAEIYRILGQLSAELASYRGMMAEILHIIVRIDVILAKKQLSAQWEGVMPKLESQPVLDLKQVRHPLLLLQNTQKGIDTVSFDLHLRGANRLLLISGPNAGGKSVTLKATGLIHLMTYFGLLVPIEEASTVGIFTSVYTDIGDQQSIDEGLSTYSSHLTNLNTIINSVNGDSLVLLDEVGSGTDPKLGGAIAEGMLKVLLEKKAWGVVTTHYSSLKVFAFRQQGIVNGAMLFDKENLHPTYKLKVGKPGSSYAFEVAKQIGLQPKVIQYARKKVGKKENQVEDLLIDLQENKAIIDEQLAYIDNEKQKLSALIASYEQLNADYQVKRKKLQIKAKELKVRQTQQENQQLQELINKLEKEKNLEKAQQLKEKAVERRQKEYSKITELKEEVAEDRNLDETVKAGMTVRMLDSEMTGEVLEIKGKKAEVLFGLMKMRVNLSDIVPVRQALERRTKGINVQGVAFSNNFSPKLDIRGYRLKDAEESLQLFFDSALLNNANTLEVVHGKGSGALRKLVLRMIKDYKDFTSYWHPADEMGGDGVTYIKVG